jgi:hypothetical protein
MTHLKSRPFLFIITFLVIFTSGIGSVSAQSDAQSIVDNLRRGNLSNAQFYMDRLSQVDAARIQCRILTNFNYIFDYESKFFNAENMEWLLENFDNKAYVWPSSCELARETVSSHCLIFGSDLSPNQASLLTDVFDGISSCPTDNINCINAHNKYENAGYTEVYLYVVERYFSEAALTDISRNSCGEFTSWAEAVVKTHRGYFNLGWDVFSDFQLQSGSVSLQKTLDAMKDIVGLDQNELLAEYEALQQELVDTDSSGARGKYRMLIDTLRPYVQE